jgi:hypothetical protein
MMLSECRRLPAIWIAGRSSGRNGYSGEDLGGLASCLYHASSFLQLDIFSCQCELLRGCKFHTVQQTYLRSRPSERTIAPTINTESGWLISLDRDLPPLARLSLIFRKGISQCFIMSSGSAGYHAKYTSFDPTAVADGRRSNELPAPKKPRSGQKTKPKNEPHAPPADKRTKKKNSKPTKSASLNL